MDAVADYQRHEPHEDLRGERFVGLYAHAAVAQERLVRAEQLLGAVAPLVYAERLGGSHLLRGDYDEVATHGKFARHGIPAFLRVEERAPVVHDVEEPVVPCAELGLGVFLALKEPRRRIQRLFQRVLLAVRAFDAVEHVEVLLAGVLGVELSPDGLAVRTELPYGAVARALERAAGTLHHVGDEDVQALYDHHIGQAQLVHQHDVRLAEVAAVEDEAYVPVAVLDRLGDHALQLRHVHDAARVLLVEERLAVSLVVGHGVVEYGRRGVVLRVAVFGDPHVARLAVLVGRVVGDVDALLPVAPPVPGLEEARRLLESHGPEEL